jgi:HK97 gp10 family phage protein
MSKISDTRLQFEVNLPGLEELRREFRQLPSNVAARYLGSALKKASQPLRTAIRRNTPRGPTGNLQKSVGIKAKTFPKRGTAYVIVGYQNSGGERGKGYHQGLVEFGTKDRKTKGTFASSFNSRGQFQIAKPRKLGKRPQNLFGPAGDRFAARYRARLQVKTTPKLPKAFFKRSKDGEVVRLGKMPQGGRKGQPPIKAAFGQSKSSVESELKSQLERSLENAFRELAEKARRGGSFR